MQADGSGCIYPQNGVDLVALVEQHVADGFTYCSGVIGVPITFLDKYCPEQFEIVWTSDRGGDGMLENIKIRNAVRYDAPVVNSNGVYKRIFIKMLI